MTTDDRLDRIIELLEALVRQNAPAPGLLEQEYAAKLKAAIACGVPPFGHHVLRHTFASRLAENGIPPYVLQRLMGHESQSTTSKIYVHIGGDFVATEARKFRDR